ncbi:hypothetical protein BU23DRAFT_551713 [Bimuria novae-zelandiae CBS 107.79]|uniref:Asl1-like glycosyl hydrolase catalytic domain-containing protein n=1 Tax=Bimuria novae-zelandiae CBS 107.79 TaxID=1447943 RepID=A0A6A5VHU0_9PLEO|nr:hypothetical protein BU23DRAFT_551713 [Bimuria novae-zelandiae CBS 107.79]
MTRDTRPRRGQIPTLLTILTTSTLLTLSATQNSKRGIAYVGNPHVPDNALLTSTNTPLIWYYNWAPSPPREVPSANLEFVPLIHGLDEASSESTGRQLSNLPDSSRHLLSFNEPDGTTNSGGSSISPEDAAQSYIEHIVPMRNGNRAWKISQPSVTGSGNGLDWLRRFNESCYELDAENGCPADFIAAHWYGAFDGLASWLGTLDEFYNTNGSRGEGEGMKIWVTELALPQQDAQVTVQMMNLTLPYLDQLDYVERYAWFGAFRADDANEWTGDGVALFDDDGGLTELGALYMGDGFSEGQKGEGEGAAGQLLANWRMMLPPLLTAVWFSIY